MAGGNLYKRGPIWWCRFRVAGVEYRRSLRTRSKAEALKRLTVEREKVAHVRYHGEARRTWKQAVVDYIVSASSSVAPGTLLRYQVSLAAVRPVLDALYVDEIGRKEIAKIAARKGVTNATRRRDLTAVSAVLAREAHDGVIDDNPALAWNRRRIPERRDPIVLPEPGDVAAVVALAPGNFAKMILTARQTGMRQEEIASLKRHQIHRERRAVQLVKTKGGKARAVPLSDEAYGTITGTPTYMGSEYVFWHGKGARYLNVSSRFAAIVRRAAAVAKKAGQPFRPFRFHDLRHLFAVEYLRGGGGIYRLQQTLGHSSVKTTEMYLQFLTPEEAARAKEAM